MVLTLIVWKSIWKERIILKRSKPKKKKLIVILNKSKADAKTGGHPQLRTRHI
jgi:hypothetical protein